MIQTRGREEISKTRRFKFYAWSGSQTILILNCRMCIEILVNVKIHITELQLSDILISSQDLKNPRPRGFVMMLNIFHI